MNFIKWLGLVLTKEAKDIYEAGEEYVVHTMRLLYVSIGIPAVMLVLGVIFGAIGEGTGAQWLVGIARWSLALSGFLATLLLTLFWIRAVVFSHLIVAASKGVAWLWEDGPSVEMESAQAFLRWLRGVTLWISAIALYAQIVPVWRNLWVSLLVGTCVLIFSAMMSAKWFDGIWARRVLAFAVVAIFTVSTVTLVSPGFSRSVQSWLDRNYGRADAWNERNDRLAAVDHEAAASAAETDARLLRDLTARRNELRRRAVELCRGDFCNDAERREYAEIGERIERLRAGTYWDRREETPERTRSDRQELPPPSGARSERRGSASDLPPPPGPRVRAERPEVPSDARSSVTPRPARTDLDEVFRELDKYPDL